MGRSARSLPRLSLGTVSDSRTVGMVPRLSLGMVSDSRTMSDSRTVSVCQEISCLLADFDAPAAAGLLRVSPERRPPPERAEVEARRAHYSRFVNNAG